MNRAPVVGHISSLRAAEQDQKKVTLKDASKKHIDPFTGMTFICELLCFIFEQAAHSCDKVLLCKREFQARWAHP